MTANLQPEPILQSDLPDAPWLTGTNRLPGTGPGTMADVLRVDDAYAAQMALRARLIDTVPTLVYALAPDALPAAREALDTVLGLLGARPDFGIARDAVIRPDGVETRIDRDRPLMTLGRLVQNDVCLMQKRGDEHILTGAILCFPASWTLAEKINRPLSLIHGQIDEYDDNITRRVQRLFDGIQVGRPLVRFNALRYRDASLFQPRREGDRRPRPLGDVEYVRSERQCLFRLPRTDAVVFAIHTTVLRHAGLGGASQQALKAYMTH